MLYTTYVMYCILKVSIKEIKLEELFSDSVIFALGRWYYKWMMFLIVNTEIIIGKTTLKYFLNN